MLARFLLPVVLVATQGAASQPVTTAPSNGDLREIGRVRASALCSTLRDHVRPAVQAMIKNDELIGAGHRSLVKISRDVSNRSSAGMDMDQYYLRQVQGRLTHNLATIESILKSRTNVAAKPTASDDRSAAALNEQLGAVIASQRKALDFLSGVLDTEALGQMQNDLPTAMQNATAFKSPTIVPTPGPVSFLGAAGIADDPVAPGLPTIATKAGTLAGHTPYDALTTYLEGVQARVAERETRATTAVLASVALCTGSSPSATAPASPEPAPRPSATELVVPKR